MFAKTGGTMARAEGGDRIDEERLAHALLSRGLVTAEEIQGARAAAGAAGPEGLLIRLVGAGSLTRGQAKRAQLELASLMGQKIPGYVLMEKLGAGAMGVVYKARQISMDRLVAIKILHPKLVSNTSLLERLKREAHLAAKLSHNNIVQAIDVGSAGPLHYFVMEIVEGRTVRQDLDGGKIFTEKEALEVVIQVAQALAHAHRRGLIHRDVKPANIVVTAEGVVKLADLGLARTTKDDTAAASERGFVLGTPFYIAPEQVEGVEDIDGRADLYALGATLYHMTTGQPPFPINDVDELLDAHLHQELTPPDHLNPKLSSGLGEVVELLLAKDRKHRYRNADDLIIDLECLLAGEAPKLARQRIEAGTLSGLAEGEAEGEVVAEGLGNEMPAWVWPTLAGLAGTLTLSIILNLILILRR
jgi:serine/threonine-protein kinase